MDKNLALLIIACTIVLALFGGMMDAQKGDGPSTAHKFNQKIEQTVAHIFKSGCQ